MEKNKIKLQDNVSFALKSFFMNISVMTICYAVGLFQSLFLFPVEILLILTEFWQKDSVLKLGYFHTYSILDQVIYAVLVNIRNSCQYFLFEYLSFFGC